MMKKWMIMSEKIIKNFKDPDMKIGIKTKMHMIQKRNLLTKIILADTIK